MLTFLENTLLSFRSCFTRNAAFKWFVTVVIAFILCDDHLGVTSVIRALFLDHGCYHTMLHFFRSGAYTTQGLREHWYSLIKNSGLALMTDNRIVLAGDGVKQSKEGYRMPGVKKLHQESEDSSKGEYIFGHLFGAVGVMVSNARQCLCLPLRMSIQDGLSTAASWNKSTISAASHVVQMIENGYEAARIMGDAIFLLDRYFLTIPAVRRLEELNASGGRRIMELVTKAKRNCIAYELPPERKAGMRGRPRKKGAKIVLAKLFDDLTDFNKADVTMYGEKHSVQYLCRDLLWGQGQYTHLRFVLVVYNGTQSILASTDRSLMPEQIIELYARRFRIENLFREFKQQIGGFCYHFWSKKLGRLHHFKKKDEPDNLASVTNESAQECILRTIDATERFVQTASIAMGLIQMMILQGSDLQEIQDTRYLRTKTPGKISEATLMYHLRQVLLLGFAKKGDSVITQIITEHQQESKDRQNVA